MFATSTLSFRHRGFAAYIHQARQANSKISGTRLVDVVLNVAIIDNTYGYFTKVLPLKPSTAHQHLGLIRDK
jgi:hypothetical protein